MRRALLLTLLASQLAGCATAKVLDSNDPHVPLIYGGTRLDWYSLNGGCCPRDHFGSEAPDYPALDLPLSALADTLLLPITLLTELGVRVGVRGGS